MYQPTDAVALEGMPLYRDASHSVEARVDDLLARMTLAEKIGQMTQIEKNSIAPDAVRDHAIGSVLSGGGGNPAPNTPEAWAAMVHAFEAAALESRLRIPLLYGVDAVHGHSNLRGATIFPHNIGLGATRNPDLVSRIAQVTARELLATGVHWNFAPTIAVPQDVRWGRTYEGFSQETQVVSDLGAAYVRGLQGDAGLDAPEAALASVKHFVGDGGTTWGSSESYAWLPGVWQSDGKNWRVDQGVTEGDETTLRTVHLAPYRAAIEAGARAVMVSYSSWGGLKMHAHRYLITEVLKGEMGFTGFVVSDWMAIDQISPIYHDCVVTGINAGLDMIMVPYDAARFIQTLTAAVEQGDVPLSRIDDAVRRILAVKIELGLFERPFGASSLLPAVGSPAHRAVAREAVRQSLVLLKNEGDTLPLASDLPHLLVAGEGAGDIGLQCGGWTIEWLGSHGPITPGTTLIEAIRERAPAGMKVEYAPDGQVESDSPRAPVGLLVLSEPPYAEGFGDQPDLTLPAEDVALLERMRAQVDRLIVLLYTGRPRILTAQLPHCDALVVAWLPGTEGQGLADVLFGDFPFTGRLPYAWPDSSETPLFPVGYGLTA